MNYGETQKDLRHLAFVVVFSGLYESWQGFNFAIIKPRFTINDIKLNKVSIYQKDGKIILLYDHKAGGRMVTL